MPEPAFLTPLNVREIDGETWELLTPLLYRHEDGRLFIVPAGTVTDFASIPRGLWNIFPKSGKHNRAAVVHDYLCQTQILGHVETHKLFRTALKACGVNKLNRNLMYAAVRCCGPKWGTPETT